MFFGGEDDEESFVPSGVGSSKLASLFGIDRTSSDAGNSSLTYTAPKEPRKKQQEESSEVREAASTAVIHAVPVTAYKLEQGSFTSQGKLGAAIIGNHSEHSYKLLLYVSKQQQVTHVVITASFQFTIQPNNYANFYDSSRQNWSVLFESSKQLSEFARQIAIAKANSVAGSPDSLISQDLGLGDGEGVEQGDSVEVKYTGWLWEKHGPGQVFDTNSNCEKLFRFRLGKGKVLKGWEEGIVGMKKGSTRLLVVPHSLGYGTEGSKNPKVPPGATLIFEIDMVRVKLAREKESPQPTQTSAVPRSDTESKADDGVRARSRSMSEQLEHHEPKDTDKAKLISRMAKMGQPMLPGIITATPGQPDHENEESSTAVPTSPKPVLATKPVLSSSAHSPVTVVHSPVTSVHPSTTPVHPTASQPVHSPSIPHPMLAHLHPEQVSQMALFQPMPQSHLTQSMYQPYMPAPATMYAPQPYPGVSSDVTVMMSESRQQNTEVRLAVGSIADKVDRLTEKIDRLERGPSSAVAMMGALPNMDTDVLLHNLHRIIQENDRLRKDLAEKATKVDTQNDKISELLQRNQTLLEQNSAFLEKSSTTFQTSANQNQARTQALEQEKAQIAVELSASKSQVGALQATVESLRTHQSDLGRQVAAFQDSEDKRKNNLKLTEINKDDHQRHLQEEISNLKTVNETLEKRLTDLQRTAAEEKKNLEEQMDKLKAQQQVSSADKKLVKEWQEKCDRIETSAREKHQRELQEWKAERQRLEERVQAIETKYANLRSRAAEMKGNYEEQLERERDTKGGEGGMYPQAVTSEVKKIMNSVYQTLRTKFTVDETYSGVDIHSTILHAIKSVTLQLVESQKTQGREEETSSDEEEQEDGEETEHSENGSSKSELTDIKDSSVKDADVSQIMTGKLSCNDSGVDESLSHVPCEDDNRSNNADVDTTDVHTTDGAMRNEGREHEGSTVGQSAATSVMTDGSEREKQETMEEKIEATMSPAGSKSPDAKESIVEETVRAVRANVSGGGGGNPHYAAQLNAAGMPQGVGKVQKNIEPVITAKVTSQVSGKAPERGREEIKGIVASTTGGGGGNPHYLAQLTGTKKGEIQTIIEPVVTSKVSSSSGAQTDEIKAVVSHVTGGGGGNPHYAAELEKGGKGPGLGDIIKPVVASTTGDRGNPHYADELENSGRSKEGKKSAKREESKDSRNDSGGKAGSMDAIFAGISDAMEDTGKKSKGTPSKAKQDDILAATNALFGDPVLDVTNKGSKKPNGKKSSSAAAGKEKNASKSATTKPSSTTVDSDDDLKPRPPPQPLFDDDEESEDLDWMK